MMDKCWVLKSPGDPEKIAELSNVLNIDRSLSNLLVQRGIATLEDARTFFRPTLDNLFDPFLMKDMDKAIARITRALDKKENILVYGIMMLTELQPFRWFILFCTVFMTKSISIFPIVTMKGTAFR